MPPLPRRDSLAKFMLLTALALGIAVVAALPAPARQPGAPRGEPAAGLPKVPPLPEGTPQQLMDFVDELKQANVRPGSRKEMMAYMSDVAAVSLQAADKILAQVKPADPLHERAAKMKLEALSMLARLGNEKAGADMAAFAATLVDSPSKALAREAQRLLIVADAQKMLAGGDAAKGAAIVERTAALLAADPDDQQTAGLAMQLAGAIEQMPGGETLAASAYQSFGSAFAKSSNERIREMSKSFEGTLRRLSLPGKPMQISGTLLKTGKAFDQKSLAGKVVLVDFWATWCGPCVAEIPNVLEQYEKYHDKGFEVVGVSLDEDREALEKFVTEQKIPWPILYEKPEGEGWSHPLAKFYGISGIPTVVLIGRDGNVITLDARGEKLGERLAEIFKKAG